MRESSYIAFTRQLKIDRVLHYLLAILVELMGYKLNLGIVLFGCIYLLHHREDLYPEPNQFKPERFLERQFSAFEFIPFGGGDRRCIGSDLAMFEMKLVLATILLHYQLTLADNQPEQPAMRGITLAPARGVKIVFQDKRTLIEHQDRATANFLT